MFEISEPVYKGIDILFLLIGYFIGKNLMLKYVLIKDAMLQKSLCSEVAATISDELPSQVPPQS